MIVVLLLVVAGAVPSSNNYSTVTSTKTATISIARLRALQLTEVDAEECVGTRDDLRAENQRLQLDLHELAGERGEDSDALLGYCGLGALGSFIVGGVCAASEGDVSSPCPVGAALVGALALGCAVERLLEH